MDGSFSRSDIDLRFFSRNFFFHHVYVHECMMRGGTATAAPSWITNKISTSTFRHSHLLHRASERAPSSYCVLLLAPSYIWNWMDWYMQCFTVCSCTKNATKRAYNNEKFIKNLFLSVFSFFAFAHSPVSHSTSSPASDSCCFDDDDVAVVVS